MKNYQLELKEIFSQLEIDFNVNRVDQHLKEFKTIKNKIGRSRKWTEDRLLVEISKFKTLKDFRSQRPHLWAIYKHLVLLPKFSNN